MTDNLRRSINSGNGSFRNMAQGNAEAHNLTTATVADSSDQQSELALNIQALQILDSSDDCIKVLNLDGRILFMSRGGQDLLDIQDIAPFLNTSWIEFWQGADQQAVSEAIALTAYAAEVDQQKALQAEFQIHITKPVDPEALLGAIVSLLRSR